MKKDIYGPMLNNPGVDFRAVRDGRRSPLFWKDFDLSVARSVLAGTQEVFNAAGDSFFADMDPVNQGVGVVHFQDVTLSQVSAPVYVSPGFIASVPFTQMLLENAAQPGKRLRIFYGVGLDFRPSGAQQVNVAGSVTVIDSDKARSLAGTSFGVSLQIAGVAAQFSRVQLWNGLATGKNLVVRKLISTLTGGTGDLLLTKNNAQIAGALPTPVNKLLGSAAAAVAVIQGTTSAVGFATANILGTYFAVAAGVQTVHDFKDPIIVPPGQAFQIGCDVAAVGIAGSFEFSEEPV